MLALWPFLGYLGCDRLRRDKTCNRFGNCRVKRSMGAIKNPHAVRHSFLILAIYFISPSDYLEKP
jgi:hypothetical protein